MVKEAQRLLRHYISVWYETSTLFFMKLSSTFLCILPVNFFFWVSTFQSSKQLHFYFALQWSKTRSSLIRSVYFLTQAADGTYNGFIKVHLKLRRPVTLISKDANSSGNSENSSAADDISDKRTSFYLPSEAVKQLHVSSTTTVREVIEGLLRKYMVQDNPLKFALYKQMHRHGQGKQITVGASLHQYDLMT